MKVYLLTSGDGSDGDSWTLHGVFSTMQLAEKAEEIYERDRPRPDGTHYKFEANVEVWDMDEFNEVTP